MELLKAKIGVTACLSLKYGSSFISADRVKAYVVYTSVPTFFFWILLFIKWWNNNKIIHAATFSQQTERLQRRLVSSNKRGGRVTLAATEQSCCRKNAETPGRWSICPNYCIKPDGHKRPFCWFLWSFESYFLVTVEQRRPNDVSSYLGCIYSSTLIYCRSHSHTRRFNPH